MMDSSLPEMEPIEVLDASSSEAVTAIFAAHATEKQRQNNRQTNTMSGITEDATATTTTATTTTADPAPLFAAETEEDVSNSTLVAEDAGEDGSMRGASPSPFPTSGQQTQQQQRVPQQQQSTPTHLSAAAAQQRKDQSEMENRTAFHAQVKAQLAVLHGLIEQTVVGRKGIFQSENSTALSALLLEWIQAIATPPPTDVSTFASSQARLTSPLSAFAGASAAAAATYISIPNILTSLRQHLFAVVSPHTSMDAGRLMTMATTLVHVCAVRCTSVIQYRINKVLALQQLSAAMMTTTTTEGGAGSPSSSPSSSPHFQALSEAVTGLRLALQIIVDFAPYVSASTFSSSAASPSTYNYAGPATRLCIMACTDALKHHFKIAGAIHGRVLRLMGATGLANATACNNTNENSSNMAISPQAFPAAAPSSGLAPTSSSTAAASPPPTASAAASSSFCAADVKRRADAILATPSLIGRFVVDDRLPLLLQDLSDIMRIPLSYLLRTVSLLSGKGGLTASNALIAQHVAAQQQQQREREEAGSGNGNGNGAALSPPPALEPHLKICVDIQSTLFQLTEGATKSYVVSNNNINTNGRSGSIVAIGSGGGFTPTSAATAGTPLAAAAAAASAVGGVYTNNSTTSHPLLPFVSNAAPSSSSSSSSFAAEVCEAVSFALFRPPLHQLLLVLPTHCGDDDDGKLLSLRLLQETIARSSVASLRTAMADHELRKVLLSGIVSAVVSPHASVVEAVFASLAGILRAAPAEVCQEAAFLYCTVVTRLLEPDRSSLAVKEIVLDHFINAMVTPMVEGGGADSKGGIPLILYLFHSFDLNPFLGSSCDVLGNFLSAIDRVVRSPSNNERRAATPTASSSSASTAAAGSGGRVGGSSEYPLVAKGLEALSRMLEALSLCGNHSGGGGGGGKKTSSPTTTSVAEMLKLRAERQHLAEEAAHNPVKVIKKYFKISEEDFNQHTIVVSPVSIAAGGGEGGSGSNTTNSDGTAVASPTPSTTTTTTTVALDKTKSLEAKDVPPCPPHLKAVMKDVVDFLMYTPTLTPAAVGEFLSDNKIFPLQCCRELLGRLELRGHSIAAALCEMLTVLELPKEGQRIERLLEFFAEMYFEANVTRKEVPTVTLSGDGGGSGSSGGDVVANATSPQSGTLASPSPLSTAEGGTAAPTTTTTTAVAAPSSSTQLVVVPSNFFPYETVDATYVVTVATVMLNTDLHNPRIATKMTKKSFGAQLKGCNNNKNFPDGFGDAIFDAISRKPLSRGKSGGDDGGAASPSSSAASPVVGGGTMDMFFFSSEEHKEVLRTLERQRLVNGAREWIDRASCSHRTDALDGAFSSSTAGEGEDMASSMPSVSPLAADVAKELFTRVFPLAHRIFLKAITEPTLLANEESLKQSMQTSVAGLKAALACAINLGSGLSPQVDQILQSLQTIVAIRAVAPLAYSAFVSVIANVKATPWNVVTAKKSGEGGGPSSSSDVLPPQPVSPLATALSRHGWAAVFKLLADCPSSVSSAASLAHPSPSIPPSSSSSPFSFQPADRQHLVEKAWANIGAIVKSAEMACYHCNSNTSDSSFSDALLSSTSRDVIPLFQGFHDAIIRVKPSDGLALGTYCTGLRKLLFFSIPTTTTTATATQTTSTDSPTASNTNTSTTRAMSSYAFARVLPNLFVVLSAIHSDSDECFQVLMETVLTILLESWVVTHAAPRHYYQHYDGKRGGAAASQQQHHFSMIRSIYDNAPRRMAILRAAQYEQDQLMNAYATADARSEAPTITGSVTAGGAAASSPSPSPAINIVNVAPTSPLPTVVLLPTTPTSTRGDENDAATASISTQRVKLHAVEYAKTLAVELLSNARVPRGGSNASTNVNTAAIVVGYEEEAWSVLCQILTKAIYEPSTAGTEVCSVASAALRNITAVACNTAVCRYWNNATAAAPHLANTILRRLADVAYVGVMCADIATARLCLVQLFTISTAALNNPSSNVSSMLINSGPNSAPLSRQGSSLYGASRDTPSTTAAAAATDSSYCGNASYDPNVSVASDCLFAILLCVRGNDEVVRSEALQLFRNLLVQLHQGQIEEGLEVLCHIVTDVVLGQCTAESHVGGGVGRGGGGQRLVNRLHRANTTTAAAVVSSYACTEADDPFLLPFYRLGFTAAALPQPTPSTDAFSPQPSSSSSPSPSSTSSQFSPTVLKKASRTAFLNSTLPNILELLVKDVLAALPAARVVDAATTIIMTCLIPIVCSGRSTSSASRSLRALCARCITDTIANATRNSHASATTSGPSSSSSSCVLTIQQLFKDSIGIVSAYVVLRANTAAQMGLVTSNNTNTLASSSLGFAASEAVLDFSKSVATVFSAKNNNGSAPASSSTNINAISATTAASVGGRAVGSNEENINDEKEKNVNANAASNETRESLVDTNMTLLAYLFDAYSRGLPLSRRDPLTLTASPDTPTTAASSCCSAAPVLLGIRPTDAALLVELLQSVLRLCACLGLGGRGGEEAPSQQQHRSSQSQHRGASNSATPSSITAAVPPSPSASASSSSSLAAVANASSTVFKGALAMLLDTAVRTEDWGLFAKTTVDLFNAVANASASSSSASYFTVAVDSCIAAWWSTCKSVIVNENNTPSLTTTATTAASAASRGERLWSAISTPEIFALIVSALPSSHNEGDGGGGGEWGNAMLMSSPLYYYNAATSSPASSSSTMAASAFAHHHHNLQQQQQQLASAASRSVSTAAPLLSSSIAATSLSATVVGVGAGGGAVVAGGGGGGSAAVPPPAASFKAFIGRLAAIRGYLMLYAHRQQQQQHALLLSPHTKNSSTAVTRSPTKCPPATTTTSAAAVVAPTVDDRNDDAASNNSAVLAAAADTNTNIGEFGGEGNATAAADANTAVDAVFTTDDAAPDVATVEGTTESEDGCLL